MTEPPADVVESVEPPKRTRRHWRRWGVIIGVLLLLFGGPWWTLLASGTAWPPMVFFGGTALFVAMLAAMPALMMLGHGHRHLDWAATAGDVLLGAAWVLFVWSLLGQALH